MYIIIIIITEPSPQNKTAGRLFRALNGSPFSNKAFSSPGGVAENIITCRTTTLSLC